MYGYVNIYSDSSCTSLLLSQTLSLGCAYENNYYYYGSEVYSFSLACSTDSDLPLDKTVTYSLERYVKTF